MLPGGLCGKYDAPEGKQSMKYLECSEKADTERTTRDPLMESRVSVLNTHFMPDPVHLDAVQLKMNKI